MKIALIAAMSKNRVIGINNDLPWHLPDDMKHFMETTRGHVVIMGRKNFESLPPKYRPLPNRVNVIITRQEDYEAKDCIILKSMEEAVHFAESKGEEQVFIIGGGQIYEIGMPLADELYLTEIETDIANGEVFFPKVGKEWVESSRVHHQKDDRHQYAFDFVRYKRETP